MKKVAIIHFQPIEYFPPVKNLIDCVVSQKNRQLVVCSTQNKHRRKNWFTGTQNVRINRVCLGTNRNILSKKILFHAAFLLQTLKILIHFKPDTLLYCGSEGAIPTFIYLLFCKKNLRLAIHYHEYSTRQWYQHGPLPVRWGHWIERRYLFRKAHWISQTNFNRLGFFYRDNPMILPESLFCVPNYPPPDWKKTRVPKNVSGKIRLIYVGSLSLKDTWLEKLCQWLQNQQQVLLTLDVYCYNYSPETRWFLESCQSEIIRFFPEGIDYDSLPDVLPRYDVGLILYKAQTTNFQYNLPNKLFEYLRCGLEVWFPSQMLLMKKMATRTSRPRIMEVDFENLHEFDLQNPVTAPRKETTLCFDNEAIYSEWIRNL